MQAVRLKLWHSTQGVAAVEFAAVAPLFILFFGLMIDFAAAFNTQMRVAGAVSAAAQHAYVNGQSLAADNADALVKSVVTVARSTAGLPQDVDVDVQINAGRGAENAGQYYCVTGTETLTWSSTGTVSGPCPDRLRSGKYIAISITAHRSYFFLPNAIAQRLGAVSDSAIVRLK